MRREERIEGTHSRAEARAHADAGATVTHRRLDLLGFGVIALVIVLLWVPMLASGRRTHMNDDFLLHASRHEAVRKSIVQHHTFPLRSHWFGGGYPTLGEPEDPALNPLVVLSVLFGATMGLKLIGFVAALTSALATYALARHILAYTRWGALFSALVIGTSPFAPSSIAKGNISELCMAYLPLCMLLIALSCRGRRAALFLLPLVFCTMLSQGKQGFFTAMLYLGVFCLLSALRPLNTLGPGGQARKFDPRALGVLALALVVALFVGMMRVLPALEFINAQGGLTHMALYPYASRLGSDNPNIHEFLDYACGIHGLVGYGTIGWLPMLLFAISACCFWKRSLPWVVTVVLFAWLALGESVRFSLFGLLKSLPVFSAIAMPHKYFCFQFLLSIAIGAGQFFWLLGRLQRKWLEHVCAVPLILAAVGILYANTTWVQRESFHIEMPPERMIPQEEFFSIQGLGLQRNRIEPALAVAYHNLLRNVGTLDWYIAMPMAESAMPRYFVGADNTHIPNSRYRGEAFLVEEPELSRQAPSSLSQPPAPATGQTGSDEHRSAGDVAKPTFRPNSITAQVTIRRPATLVINQNYHRAWKTDRGELVDRDGLIAVRLQETGSYTVNLSYLPYSFVVGLIVTILSIAGWTVACWRIGRGTS
jgi:hypothetical protein